MILSKVKRLRLFPLDERAAVEDNESDLKRNKSRDYYAQTERKSAALVARCRMPSLQSPSVARSSHGGGRCQSYARDSGGKASNYASLLQGS